MSQGIEEEISNRYYFNDEKEIYLDLGHVDFMWKLRGRSDNAFELKLLVEDHPRYVDEAIGKEIFQALKAYRSPPPPAPAPQRQRRVFPLSGDPTIATQVLSALQPNPIKPGVISAPEEKLDELRRAANVPDMSSVQVGHGPETSSQDIVAPEAHPPKEGEDESGWRTCSNEGCSRCCLSISSDSNSSTEEEQESIPIHNIQ